jgi:hypothetical protein
MESRGVASKRRPGSFFVRVGDFDPAIWRPGTAEWNSAATKAQSPSGTAAKGLRGFGSTLPARLAPSPGPSPASQGRGELRAAPVAARCANEGKQSRRDFVLLLPEVSNPGIPELGPNPLPFARS